MTNAVERKAYMEQFLRYRAAVEGVKPYLDGREVEVIPEFEGRSGLELKMTTTHGPRLFHSKGSNPPNGFPFRDLPSYAREVNPAVSEEQALAHAIEALEKYKIRCQTN